MSRHLPDMSAPVRRYEPLAPAAVAFIVGVILGEYVGGGMLAWCAAAVVAAGVWIALYLRRADARWLVVPLLVLVAAAGAARYRAVVDPAPDDVARFVEGRRRLAKVEGVVARFVEGGRRLATVEGVVVSSPRQTSPPDDVFLPSVPYYIRSTFTLDCRRVLTEGRWWPASGRLNVTVRQPQPPDAGAVAKLGDGVQVTGRLAGFVRPANPGAFDIPAYLHRQGVRASLSTDHWEAVRVVEPAADRVRWALGAMQRLAVASLDRLPTAEGRAIAAAMVFGRRDLLEFDSGEVHGRDIERAFLVTGTTHMLAVSGFNVGLLAAAVLVVLRLAGFGRRVTAVIVALVVLAFTLMTALEPPVLRAAILFWALCLGWALGREALVLNSLALAVILVLLVRPGDLFTTSFQLSFLAVLGMMFLADRFEGLLLRRWREIAQLRRGAWWRGVFDRWFLVNMLLVSVAATVINIPVIAARFHLVAWMAPLASTILFPLVFALTVTGMVLVGVGWIHPWVYAPLAAVTDALGWAVTTVITALAQARVYSYVGTVSFPWLVVAYLLLMAFVWHKRLGVSGRRLAIVCLAVGVVFVWTGGHRAPAHARATFLAVGSGNTTLLELPNGRNVLYDAGSSLSQTKAGESTLAPAFWVLRVDRIDAVLISHPHFDHFKDVLPLVERFGVRQVLVPPTFLRRRLTSDKKLIEALLARGVRVEIFGAGDRLSGTGLVDLAAVWPRGAKSQAKAINDGSLALVVRDGARRLLLPGDLEPAGMAALRAAEPDLRADAMLWPHHGHAPEAMRQFAAATGARVLVISAGPYASADPPAWLKEDRVVCVNTGEVGAVTVELRPEGPHVSTCCAPAQADAVALVEDEGDKEGSPD
jgi:competence protein ComEC